MDDIYIKPNLTHPTERSIFTITCHEFTITVTYVFIRLITVSLNCKLTVTVIKMEPQSNDLAGKKNSTTNKKTKDRI